MSFFIIRGQTNTNVKFILHLLGGCDNFLATIMTFVVGSLALKSRLSFGTNDPLSAPITAAMGGDSLADILGDYFMGSGIPCPGLFEEARRDGLFPSIVDLSLEDTPNFRSQMWAWAVSGAPFLTNNTADISASGSSLSLHYKLTNHRFFLLTTMMYSIWEGNILLFVHPCLPVGPFHLEPASLKLVSQPHSSLRLLRLLMPLPSPVLVATIFTTGSCASR